MRRSRFVVALCLLVVVTACYTPRVGAKPSADFGYRTVTAEQGSSFVQALTVEGTDTNYKNLEVYFEMPSGVTCADTPKKDKLDEGKEWTFSVTFHVASDAGTGTFTVSARGRWEEYDHGWEGGDSELTKFTLHIKAGSGGGGGADDGSGDGSVFSFSSPLVLGGVGIAVLAVAGAVLYYFKHVRGSGAPAPSAVAPKAGSGRLETVAKKICELCGAENSPDAEFCRSCGNKL